MSAGESDWKYHTPNSVILLQGPEHFLGSSSLLSPLLAAAPGLRAPWVSDNNVLTDVWAVLGLPISGIFFAWKILYSLAFSLFVEFEILKGKRNIQSLNEGTLSLIVLFGIVTQTGGPIMLFRSVFVALLTVILLLGALKGLFWILPEDEYWAVPKFLMRSWVCFSILCYGTSLPEPQTLVNVHGDLISRGNKKLGGGVNLGVSIPFLDVFRKEFSL